jgi:hypothetical protein
MIRRTSRIIMRTQMIQVPAAVLAVEVVESSVFFRCYLLYSGVGEKGNL